MPNVYRYFSSTLDGALLGRSGAVLSSAQARFGGGSVLCANGAHIEAPQIDATHLSMDSGDFTIEGFSYLLSKPSTFPALVSNFSSFSSNSIAIYAGGSTGSETRYLVAITNSGFPNITSTSTIVYNQWQHWALTRLGNVFTLWIQGTSQGSATIAANLTSSIGWTFGNSRDLLSSSFINGHLNWIRIKKGIALYTAPFTPPSVAFGTNSGGDATWSNTSLVAPLDSQFALPARGLQNGAGRFAQFASPAFSASGFSVLPLMYRIDYGGRGKIYGTVKIKSATPIPVARAVRLIRDVDGVCVSEVWSDPATGYYEFVGFDPRVRYTVLTYDYTNNYRAVVADNLTAEVI